MAGLDPATHSMLRRTPRHRVGPRVTPGGDVVGGVVWSARGTAGCEVRRSRPAQPRPGAIPNRASRTTLSVVMAGLDPAIHSMLRRTLRHRVGPRVTPGGDVVGGVVWSARGTAGCEVRRSRPAQPRPGAIPNRVPRTTPSVVMAGLDPAIHSMLRSTLRHRVGPRVTPGGDVVGGMVWSAQPSAARIRHRPHVPPTRPSNPPRARHGDRSPYSELLSKVLVLLARAVFFPSLKGLKS